MLYFIQGTITKNIKIGRTSGDIQRRLNQICSSDPLVCLRTVGDKDMGSISDENHVHQILKDSWSHGEWFRPTPEVLALVNHFPENEHTGLTQNKRPKPGRPKKYGKLDNPA